MRERFIALDDIYRSLKNPDFLQKLQAEEAMTLASELAWKGTGYVRSNPLVGAVCLDKQQRFVAGAWHEAFGKAHAEQALIQKIYAQGKQELLKDATIYVTLEPCAHVGKTPSCAQLLSDLPIVKVVYGLPDPTKKTAGKGPALLQNCGVLVEQFKTSPELEQKLRELVEHFYSFEILKRPLVSAKIASSLNGVYSFAGAERAWITGPRARAYGHWLRLYHDAIIVGADTVIQDNPSLTVRDPVPERTPLRIVVDPSARALNFRTLAKNHLLKGEREKTLWCLTKKSWQSLDSIAAKALEQQGVKVLKLEENKKENIFNEILDFLFGLGIASLLIEGGSGVWASAFNGNKVDKLYLFQAPKIFCHQKIMPWTQGLKIDGLDLKQVTLTRLHEDLLIEGYTREQSKSLQ